MEVKLRERERRVDGKITRTTLYLSWWIKEERKWKIEPLKLYLYPGKDRKSQNDETLALAKRVRNMRQCEIDAGSYEMVPESKKRSDFILFVANLAKTKDRNWKQAARILKEYSPTPVSFRALNFENGPRWMLDFQKYLLKKYKNNMAWLIEVKIRAAIREALGKGLIAKDFLDHVPSIRYNRPPHTFFTAAEIEKLNSTPFPEYPDVRRAALFSIFTGLRWSDYSELTWKNIQGGYVCFVQEKTEEATQLPLNANAMQILDEEKIINPENKIFTLPGYNRFLQLLEIWRRRAGITKKFTTHCGRHSYGHLLAQAGFDTYRIQQALGQKTMDAAIVYTHLVKGELKGELDEKLPAFNIKRATK